MNGTLTNTFHAIPPVTEQFLSDDPVHPLASSSRLCFHALPVLSCCSVSSSSQTLISLGCSEVKSNCCGQISHKINYIVKGE